MAIDSLTAGEIIFEVAGLIEDREEEGTLTTGGTTTHVDVNNLAKYAVNDHQLLLGKTFIIYKGTSAGSSQPISAFTASSDQITVPVAITLTDNTSKYFIAPRFRLQDYLDTLRGAQRELRAWRPVPYVKEAVGREIVIGNALINGAFDLYTTANVPDGMTLDGNSTFTEETVITKTGRRSLKGVTDGANAGFVRQTIPNWGRFKGAAVLVFAWVRASTASRVTLELTDGVNTQRKTLETDDAFEWPFISPLSFNASATQLQASIEVSAGSAVTFYVDFLYVPDAPSHRHRYILDADRNLWAIEKKMRVSDKIGPSGAGGSTFQEDLPSGVTDVVYTTPRELELALGKDTSFNSRILQYRGWAYHDKVSAVTTTWTGDPEPLIWTMAARLAMRKDRAMAAEFEAKAREFRTNFQVPVKLPLLYIEPN